jgi:hypothetical protein
MSAQPVSRLGSLLQEFGVINSSDLQKAEELSLFSGLPFGKCLTLLDLITDNDLKAILECQSLLREGVFDRGVLAKAMQKVGKEHVGVPEALNSLGVPSKTTRRTRLGELLSDAQAVSPKQLEVALRAADFSALPLGHILGSFEAVEPAIVDLALELQKKIRKGEVERGKAIAQLSQANQDLSIRIAAGGGHFALGEILRFAKLLSSAQIDQALDAARQNKQLLGEYLVEQRLITDETLTAALCVQNLISADLLAIDSACDLLSNVAKFKVGSGADFKGITFQDFLKTSGYLTNSKLRTLMTTLSRDPNQTLDVFKHSLQETATLRKLLAECYPEDTSLINAGSVLFQLVQVEKISLNQALLTFAFRKNGVAIKEAVK